MLPQKILKMRCSEMLFPAISVIYLLRSFYSLHSIHTPPISMELIHDSFSHLSLFMIPKF